MKLKHLCSLCLAAVLGIAGLKVSAQDTFYTQFFSVPMLINPAFAGINQGVKVRFDYRNQWPVLPKAYQAYYFSADYGDRGLPGSGGIGLIFNNDNEGTGFIHNLEVGLDISVRIRVSTAWVTQLGIKASYRQKTVNWDDFVFTDELSSKYGNINPTTFNNPGSNRRSAADFGVGGLVQYISQDQVYDMTVGFAVDHLFQPNMSFLTTGEAPLYRRWVLHADGTFALGGGSMYGGSGDALLIKPGVVWQKQYNMSTLELGLNLTKYNIYLGTWFKTALSPASSNCLAVLAGYNLRVADNVAVKFIYSYDIPISGAYSSTGGAHEISLVLSFEGVSIFGGGGGSGPTLPRGGGSKKWGALECSDFY